MNGGVKMRPLLELLRLIIIFVLLGGVGWMVIRNIYTVNEATADYMWFGVTAILLLLFVLYRNKLQFSGWYKGKNKEKLPKAVSLTLTLLSLLLFITPFIVGCFIAD